MYGNSARKPSVLAVRSGEISGATSTVVCRDIGCYIICYQAKTMLLYLMMHHIASTPRTQRSIICLRPCVCVCKCRMLPEQACIYIYTHVCIYVHVYVYVYIHIYISVVLSLSITSVFVRVQIHAYAHICLHLQLYAYVHTYTCRSPA